MRHLILAASLVFAFALAGPAQAGEGCPYSKSGTVAATADGNGHAAACAKSCPHAKTAAVASSCACKAGEGDAASTAKTNGANKEPATSSTEAGQVVSSD